MNKINYRRVSNILSENEMKHVKGGCGVSCSPEQCDAKDPCGSGAGYPYNNYCGYSSK